MGLPVLGENDSDEERIKAAEDSVSLREAAGTRQFWLYFFMSMTLSFCYIAILIHLAPYMTDLGISATTAANVMAAIQVAARLGSGHTVVTPACDSGLKYLSTDLYTAV